ncbi:MAG: SWIM zinc finger family protein [Myxococcota bacterium]
MEELPILTEEQIRAQVTAESFRRGEPYFVRGAVKAPRRTGRFVRAQCEGSRAEPYRVTVELGPDGVASAHCTCPVGADGRCKHTAAVLLAWARTPELFVVLEDLDTALQERSEEELREMMRFALRRNPELEMMLRMRFPTSEPRDAEVDGEAYREQAEHVFRENAGGSGAASQIVAGLRPIMDIGLGFLERGDHPASVSIHGAVLDAVVAHAPDVRDDEGFLRDVIALNLERMVETLDDEGAPRATRHDVLRVLAMLSMTDGEDLAAKEAERLMLARGLEEERRELAMHVRQMLRARRGVSPGAPVDSWLLLELEERVLDVETYLARCRGLGRTDAVVARLLALGRVDDALDTLAEAAPEQFMGLARAFEEHGHGGAVEEMVRERYAASGDLELLEWMQQRYDARGEARLAMATAQARFWRQPTLDLYKQMRQRIDTSEWALVRPSLLAGLEERNAWALLVRIAIDEDDVERAADLLDDARASGHPLGTSWAQLQLEIADAARESRPRTAIALYQSIAEALIEKRSASAFKEAAQVLVRAFLVARELGESAQWAVYMEELGDRYGRFQSLHEALYAVGLEVP